MMLKKKFVAMILFCLAGTWKCMNATSFREARVPRETSQLGPSIVESYEPATQPAEKTDQVEKSVRFMAPGRHNSDATGTSIKQHLQDVGPSLPLKLSQENEEIQMRLPSQREHLSLMCIEYVSLSKSVEILETRFRMLREAGRVPAAQSNKVAEIRDYCQHISEIVQLRLYQWVGFNGIARDSSSPEDDIHEILDALESQSNVDANANRWGSRDESKKGSAYSNIKQKRMGKQNSLVGKIQQGPKRLWNRMLSRVRVGLNLSPDVSKTLKSSRVFMQDTAKDRLAPAGSPNHTPDFYTLALEDAGNLEQLPKETFDQKKELQGELEFVFSQVTAAKTLRLEDTLVKNPFSYQDLKEKHKWQIKVWIEECVFQAVQYAYKFGFISRDSLKRFFLKNDDNDMTDLTATHIIDLFQMRRGGFYNDKTFVPDMNFICSHWYTLHLHTSLSVLDENEKGQILLKTLCLTIQEFNLSFNNLQSQDSVDIHRVFLDHNLLKTLKKIHGGNLQSDNCEHEGYLRVKNAAIKIVNFLQKPKYLSNDNSRTRQAEYLLNYYIFNYIRKYHLTGSLREILDDQELIGHDIVEKQLELLNIGLSFHHMSSMMSDYKLFGGELPGLGKYVNQEIYLQKRMEFKKRLNTLQKMYKIAKSNIYEESLTNTVLRSWLEGENINGSIVPNSSNHIIEFLDTLVENNGKQQGIFSRNLWLYATVNLYEYIAV